MDWAGGLEVELIGLPDESAKNKSNYLLIFHCVVPAFQFSVNKYLLHMYVLGSSSLELKHTQHLELLNFQKGDKL